MSDWQKVRLGDVTTKIGSGATPTGGANCYKDSGISLIRSQNVLDLSLTNEGLAYIDDIQAKKLNNVIVENGDVLLNITGDSVARVCMVTDVVLPARVNQHVAIVRTNNNVVNNRFLLYFLLNIKPHLLSISGIGGTRNALTKKMIEDLEITLPPIKKQRRIADILGALDDKIECNNRINRNLEEQAAVLFRRWFVDFEFPDPDPTSSTYGKPYRSTGGIFTDSTLGQIPTGWRVGIASDYFNISIGKTPPRAESHWFSRDNKDVIWVSIANMGNSGVYINDSSEYLTADSIKKFNVVLVPSNTVILSFKLTVGRVAITNGVTTTNEAIAHFKTDKTKITEYLYLLLKTYDYQSMGSTSSIATAVNSKMVKAMTITMPNEEVLSMFHKIISPIFELIKANQTENQTLAILRDTLLPKLMNNEIIFINN